MNLEQLFAKLVLVVNEYEEGGRGPQRSLELISSLFNQLDGSVSLPRPVRQIRQAVASWDEGDRADVDVLASICALSRM